MTKRQKNTLFCATLTIVLAALLIQGAAFADGLTFGREKLKGTSKTQGISASCRGPLVRPSN